ncbi:MAG: hypothetical protein GC181_11035 [Bacteroidetes bacterium]|nr:hypothetical protein [Bacteroidota bacterium]
MQRILKTAFPTLFLLIGFAGISVAGPPNYDVTFHSARYKDESLKKVEGKHYSNKLKGNSGKLLVGELSNGNLLYAEIVKETQGVNSSKIEVIYFKYYLKEKGKWRLLCDSRRVRYNGNYSESTTFDYTDPTTGESLSVSYTLKVNK